MKTFLLTLTLLLLGVATIGIVDYAIFQPVNTGGIVFSLLSLVLGVVSLYTLKKYSRRGVKDIKSFSHFVQLMVDGLEHEYVRVDMERYLYKSIWDDEMCGCAATNAICRLTGFNPERGEYELIGRYRHLAYAYNSLRYMDVRNCMKHLSEIESKLSFKLDKDKIELVKRPSNNLTNINWREDLHYYQEYADRLKAAGL